MVPTQIDSTIQSFTGIRIVITTNSIKIHYILVCKLKINHVIKLQDLLSALITCLYTTVNNVYEIKNFKQKRGFIQLNFFL